MSFAERLIVNLASYILPEKTAYRLARASLASQGVGWASPSSGLQGSGEARFLRNQISSLIRPVVFDVGANVGDYSEAALDANPSVQLHCFEPSAAHYSLLRARLSANKAIINSIGLSDTAETRSLYKDSHVTGLASLNARDLSHLRIQLDKPEHVLVDTGDNYVDRHAIERIDLIKIDVEGWEMPVLKGFNSCFAKRIVRCVQFEFGHAHIERRENFRDFYRFFNGQGFSMGALKPNGRVQTMTHYDEIFENYYATNYVAILKS